MDSSGGCGGMMIVWTGLWREDFVTLLVVQLIRNKVCRS